MTSLATIGTSPASSDSAAPVAVRLTLVHPEPAQTPVLDGAWWPRSSSLSDELPGLITELRHRDLYITRVTYNPELWDPAPRRLRADGRVIRLGWFRSIDRHLLCLTGGCGDDRLELLVVPPGTPEVVAVRAMTLAAGHGNRSTATNTLRAARIPPGVVAGVASAVPVRDSPTRERTRPTPGSRKGDTSARGDRHLRLPTPAAHKARPIGWERSTCLGEDLSGLQRR